jgi:2-methylcitrate dehydratase PrpD
MISESTRALSEYISESGTAELPRDVEDAAVLHIMDTVAAMVSGSALEPGLAAARFVARWGSKPTAGVLGTSLRADTITAALANGMSAHADETDDSHEPSLSHPGCAVVPAALAVAESRELSGAHLLRAVVAGYDCGTRLGMVIGHPEKPLAGSSHSSHAYAGVYGAAAAAAALLRLNPQEVRYALSYAAQSAAGTTTWARDPNHIEKAFVFGGMPASNGVRAAEVVVDGWDGVEDPFHGQPNAIEAVAAEPDWSRLADGLGSVFEIARTNIKKFAVGSPSQAAVQAALDVMAATPFEVADIETVEIVIPHDLAQVVDDRELPNINVQYLVAGTLVDGRFGFAMAHDPQRMVEPAIAGLRARTTLVHDTSVTGRRQATLRVVLRDGRILEKHVPSVRGTVEDPMSPAEVEEKSRDLIAPVVGEARTERILELLRNLRNIDRLGELVELCRPG